MTDELRNRIRTAYMCEKVNWYEETDPHRRNEYLHGMRLLESLFGNEFFEGVEDEYRKECGL